MDDPKSANPNNPNSWESGVIPVLQKLEHLGWVSRASLVGRSDGTGNASVDFTPLGKESLKPFADFWKKVGGLNQRDALALFFIAVNSQKP
jgi:hypothetical protein